MRLLFNYPQERNEEDELEIAIIGIPLQTLWVPMGKILKMHDSLTANVLHVGKQYVLRVQPMLDVSIFAVSSPYFANLPKHSRGW